MRILFAVAIVLVGVVLGCKPAEEIDEGNGTANAAEKARHALLVGCTRYPNLARFFWLEGPGNDVELMRRLLVERFGFPSEKVRTLAENVGDDSQRPTRANIEREFRRLASIASPGADVVIYLSGHGSFQPDDDPENPDDAEPDGFDEVFCPADVQRLEAPEGGVIPNAIRDDELSEWLDGIVARGASVWIIVDACHSGTAIRGSGEEVDRLIPADALLPKAALAAARDRASRTNGTTRGVPEEEAAPLEVADEARGLVATYASQPGEPTVEKPLPAGEPNRKRHGLFTYTLAQVLSDAAAPLTYAELVARVHARYVKWGRAGPTPLVEGPDRDREVLGSKKWPERSRILLAHDGQGRLTVSAGSLAGLTGGTVLAVHPPPGAATAEKPLGYVRVGSVRILGADVVPCPFGGERANDDLPDGGRCEIAQVRYGGLRLRTAVDRAAFAAEGLEEEAQRLDALLETLAGKEGSLIERTGQPTEADWLVRPSEGKPYLVPAEGVPKHSDDPAAGLVGPVPADRRAADWLDHRLACIARARNLLRLAAESEGEKRRGSSGGDLDVRFDMLRLENGNEKSATPVRWEREGRTLREGDVIQFRVENHGSHPVDVTLLFVDGNLAIHSIFPEPGSPVYNRIEPNQELRTEPIDVVGATTGLEHAVLIAPRGRGPTVDFSWLAQPTLESIEEKVRSAGGGGFDSPLGLLMRQGMYGGSRAVQVESQAAEDAVLKVLSWRTTGKED